MVPLGETDTPHGLARFESTCCATPGISDWKFVHEYVSAPAGAPIRVATANGSRAVREVVFIGLMIGEVGDAVRLAWLAGRCRYLRSFAIHVGRAFSGRIHSRLKHWLKRSASQRC